MVTDRDFGASVKQAEYHLATDNEIKSKIGFERSYLLKPHDVPPIQAHLTLRDLFGKPNSDYSDEEKIQWQYVITNPKALIEVYDWKLGSWSIAVYATDGKEETGKQVAESFLGHIKKKASHTKQRIKKLVEQPAGYVIRNPFALYYITAGNLLAWAKSGKPTTIPSKITDLADMLNQEYLVQQSEHALCRSAFLLYIASFEGLLNLVYELYLKKDLRDERIYERLGREQIDIKLRLAPVYCECFQSSPIDHTSDAFKNFHSIVNLRNDFVHANFTKSMKTPMVVEDDYVFFVEATNNYVGGIPRDFAELGVEHIETINQVIDDIVEELLKHMQPRFRREFEQVIYEPYVEVADEDGEMVVVA